MQKVPDRIIGTDNRWGQLYVSNTVAVPPAVNGTNFSIEAFTVGMGTQTVVAAIRDQAGNMGYATNTIFLTVVTNAQYGYSAAGCLTNISYSGTEYCDTKTLEWNAQYQLVSVYSVSSVVNYSYDVLGRRTSISDGTNTINMIYDGDQVVADVSTNGVVLRTYVWGPGIDNLLSFTDHTTSNTYYAVKDHLNSVYALVDESGSVVEKYEYDAWGRITVFNAAGDELTESAVGNRYTFQGREIDWVTGLIYFRARWYDPVSARFISNDPLGISGGLNQYVAFDNSPMNFTDSTGLCPEDPWYKKPMDWWNSYQDWAGNNRDWMRENILGYQQVSDFMNRPGMQDGLMIAMGTTSSSANMSRYFSSTKAAQVQKYWPQNQRVANQVVRNISSGVDDALRVTADGEIRAVTTKDLGARFLEAIGRIFGP
jgi:RHS repeat-associated protein